MEAGAANGSVNPSGNPIRDSTNDGFRAAMLRPSWRSEEGGPLVPADAAVGHLRAIVDSDGLPFCAKVSRPSWGHPFCEVPYSDAVGVGHNEDPSSHVGSTDFCGRKREGTRSVSEVAQLAPHRGQPGALAVRDVLDDDDRRPDFFGDAVELEPEPTSVAGETGLLAGGADVLAGETSAEEIDGGKRPSCRDVIEPLNVGPVLGEDAAAELVLLDLPEDRAQPGGLEPELETADTGEERADRDQGRFASTIARATGGETLFPTRATCCSFVPVRM